MSSEMSLGLSPEIDILRQLKNQLVNFLDDLIESIPDVPDFIIFRIFVKDKLPIVDIMEYIANKLVPLQEMVKNRNDSFFLNNNVLFEKFDERRAGKVDYFRQLWISDKLDEDDKIMIWKWFDVFIYLANKYLDIKKRV